ncbi:MAG: 1-acyl-sn-glycerol-3-phosphate acyltransferase [Treponema sp.]|jgi:1-acyl-sn-glycerol-3-phosphate acyltransferase|nr:1-acyl-sn-glycerol-3-phosphate acyltransferase [Treponema sp.]
MSLFITILIFAIVGISLILITPLGILAFLLGVCGLRKAMVAMTCVIAQCWGMFLIKLSRIRLTVKGLEHIPKTGGLCIVSNHGSIFDIVLLLALIGRRVGFIAKKELALIPFLNIWIFLIGGLFIDRKNVRKSLRTINDGVERIRRGDAMLIFPEGTRSQGRGLLPFKSGSFKLASQAGAPIVPVAITGSYDVVEKTRRIRPADVFVTFAPLVVTSEFPVQDRRKNLSELVYGIIAGELKEHEKQAR